MYTDWNLGEVNSWRIEGFLGFWGWGWAITSFSLFYVMYFFISNPEAYF